MPSLEETRKHVKEGLNKHAQEVDHDEILASLQDEIDQHNAIKDDLRSTINDNKRSRHVRSPDHSERSTKFRFKRGHEDPRDVRRRNRHRHDREERHERKRRKREHESGAPQGEENAAHPFPREPVNPVSPDLDPEDAFRASLFDALADDEGAAYWESVYSQPIHVYPRPPKESRGGHLEEMSDADYVEYVKTKMWERKHPEIVYERKKREREQKLEEEERTRAREEFVRRREQAAWERSQRKRFRRDSEDDREYEFTGQPNSAPDGSSKRMKGEAEYAAAWSKYLSAWDTLKYDLLAEHRDAEQATKIEPSKRIPWPVLASKPVIKTNIEAFMRHAPADSQAEKLRMLKAERVRWHPDKVQQRFGGKVEEGTMKLVTGVFQVVDAIVEEERKRDGG